MQGDVVTAAKWLGASIVLASLILVVGLSRALSPDRSRPEAAVAPGRADRTEDRDVLRAKVEKLLTDSETLRLPLDDGEPRPMAGEPLPLEDPPSASSPFRTHGGLGSP